MENLNLLETSIVEEIINDNADKYPFLSSHLSLLRVKNREYTGVGMYVNIAYAQDVEEKDINDLISSKKRLVIDSIKYELTYVLDITGGKVNFLEITTNGNEEWDGKYHKFELI